MLKAIVFDAFGTLVEITDKRNPFRRAGAGREAMSSPLPLAHYTNDLSLHRDLACETASIKVYPDVIPTLIRLRGQGMRIAIGSNLALPYGEPLQRLLGQYVDVMHLSYEVGVCKPSGAFFDGVCRRLGVARDNTLMLGDNYRNDFLGAMDAGMNAEMLVRAGGDTIEMLAA